MTASSLAKKLKVKAGSRLVVINPPQGYLEELEPLPEGVELEMKSKDQYDFVHLFVKDSAELAQELPGALKSLREDKLLWISYPKRRKTWYLSSPHTASKSPWESSTALHWRTRMT